MDLHQFKQEEKTMAKYMTRKEVRQLSEPTDLAREDLEGMDEMNELFVSEAGELFVIGCEDIPFDDNLWEFSGSVATYMELIEKHVNNITTAVEKYSKYEHIAKGRFNFDHDENRPYFYFIERKANIEEETEWKEERTQDLANRLEEKEGELARVIRQAQKLGIGLTLNKKAQKTIDAYNERIKAEYPDINKLLISV